MEPTTELPPDVIAALKAGRTIEAIRLLREHRSMGLKQAKQLVDRASPLHESKSASLPPLKPDNGVSQVIKVAIILGILFVTARILIGQ